MENLKVENSNSNWYKTEQGSIIFKTGDRRAFGLCNPIGGEEYWCFDGVFDMDKKTTSPIEVLKAIQRGMKQKGYHNDVIISPLNLPYHTRIKDFHFNFRNKDIIRLLMEKGKLYLENKRDHTIPKICVLRGGSLSPIVK